MRPVTPPILDQPYPVPPGPFAAARPAAPALADAARPRAAVPGDLSRSLPVAVRRPWRRIVLVLVLDVGLAASGAYLLRQGLAAAPPAPPTGAGPRSP